MDAREAEIICEAGKETVVKVLLERDARVRALYIFPFYQDLLRKHHWTKVQYLARSPYAQNFRRSPPENDVQSLTACHILEESEAGGWA